MGFSSQSFLIGIVLPIVGVIIFLAIMIPIWTTEIGVTNQRVIYKKGLISRETSEIQLGAIEEVSLRQDVLGRILDYGKLEIHGTGEEQIVLTQCQGGQHPCRTGVLSQKGVEVFESDRGGDVTFHGPGQLVGYPIFDLRAFPSNELGRKTLGAIEYVRRLEEVLIRTCASFGIPTKRIPSLTGVWTEGMEESKIAALGVHISRGVTSHGFALNVTTDLSFFNLIIPCGITTRPVTSMARELQKPPSMEEVENTVSRQFGQVFGSQILLLESLDALLGPPVGVPLSLPL